MTQPTQPTDTTSGVWIGPNNTRIDITPNPAGGWTSRVYLDRHARLGGTRTDHTNDQITNAIAGIEHSGYQRQPDLHPRTHTPPDRPSLNSWTPRNIIGALILFAAIVAIGIAIIG